MIRVNLLPVKRKKKAKAIPPFVIYGTLLTVVTLISAAYLFWYLKSQVDSLNKQKKANETTIAELENKIKEVKNYESQKSVLEQRKNIIEQLRKNQSIPVRILAEISNTLPAGVWISTMSVSGDIIKIAGSGFTNEDVVNYVDNLKKSALFTDVTLEGTQKSSAAKVVTYQFSLTCKVKTT